MEAVSYTHLDVYKRQVQCCVYLHWRGSRINPVFIDDFIRRRTHVVLIRVQFSSIRLSGNLKRQLCCFCQLVFCLCYVAVIQHLIQCFIPPLHCLLIVIVTIDDAVVGIVAVWRIDNAGEESTFRQVQILYIFAKVILCTFLDSTGMLTDVYKRQQQWIRKWMRSYPLWKIMSI